MALEVTIPAFLAHKGAQIFNENELSANKTYPNSTTYHAEALTNAAKARVAAIAPNAQPLAVKVTPNEPDGTYNSSKMASHTNVPTKDGKNVSFININPNADSSYYAHELGHGVSQKTQIGKFVNDARHFARSNPKLARAIAIALPGALAGTSAALQEGDDDLIESLAIAAAAASPELIDEALASKNALAIMNDAGLRATLGQRARLAGGYLSYLAPVIIAGSVGNAFGNAVDEKTALYDL